MNRPVKHLTTHAVPFVEGVGQLKTTLSVSGYPGMRLNAVDHGINVSFKGIDFVIPWGNVVVATYGGPDLDAPKMPAPKVEAVKPSAAA